MFHHLNELEWGGGRGSFHTEALAMQINTYKCDMCGTVKGENNHWFRVCNAQGIKLEAWSLMPSSPTTVDLCSDSCVIKVVQKWLTAQAHSTAPVHDEMRMPFEVTPPRVI